LALAAKPGSRMKIHDWCCQGVTGCSARIRRTLETEIWLTMPQAVSSVTSSGAVQCASGTLVAAGSWQASAQTSARSAR
jgi:hypothetical protein